MKTGGCLNAYNALMLTPGYDPTALPNTAPENDTPPGISGTVQVGETVTAIAGTWTDPDGDAMTYTYEWWIATDINGTGATSAGTGNSYTLAEADGGLYISLAETASDDGSPSQSATEYSTPWEPIAPAPPDELLFTSDITNTYPTSIRNKWTATVTVSTNPSMSGAKVSYEWYDGKSVTSGTAYTDGDGLCTITSKAIRKNIGSHTFTIVDITPSAGDSDYNFDPVNSVLTVTVYKP